MLNDIIKKRLERDKAVKDIESLENHNRRRFDGYKEEFVKDSNENNGSNLTKDINTDKNNSNQALGKDKSLKSKSIYFDKEYNPLYSS